MPSREQYQELMSEIIQKQIAILGPDIALHKAEQVPGLKLDRSGKVVALSGSEQEVLQALIDRYIELSGQIVKSILGPVFAKYPGINVKIP
ncbi:MAG: hypothetical protein M1275_01910 [Patescibacteria group bacterium]|nr:hypothetical protein [Patescibacteria group bacterium]